MSEKYKWMTEQEFMEEVSDLDKLLHDFCDGSDLYQYRSVQTNINALRDIIVRVHKRKHYFIRGLLYTFRGFLVIMARSSQVRC